MIRFIEREYLVLCADPVSFLQDQGKTNKKTLSVLRDFAVHVHNFIMCPTGLTLSPPSK